MSEPPPQRLLAWYGDDFTGSTDVLEVAASSGLGAVLFLQMPEEAMFQKFAGCRAFGLAGSSRSESPAWMDEHLPPAFEWLRSLGARITHYKVCSTFDSSPQVGNIGRALEIGKALFDVPWVPVVVGAPALRRYVVFGNLFAAVDGDVYRIDRHPTMSRHPVTPMSEADLRLHLARQTSMPSVVVDVLDLASQDLNRRIEARLAQNPAIVLIDVMDERTLVRAGELLCDSILSQRFVAGSSGVEYAATAWWRARGVLPEKPAPAVAPPCERLLVASGSCSPVTQGQIQHACCDGFAAVRLDVRALAGGEGESALSAAHARACQALSEGKSVCLYTSSAPEDTLQAPAEAPGALGRRLAEALGDLVSSILGHTGVRRVVIAGGDTASHAGRRLGIEALTFNAPLAPGAPLCRAWSSDPARDGLEIVFKGGQCGGADFFSRVRDGGR